MDGMVEIFGYSTTFNGLVVGGWVSLTWEDPVDLPPVHLKIDNRDITGGGYICLYTRDDIRKIGFGFILIIDSIELVNGAISELTLDSGSNVYLLPATADKKHFDDNQLVDHIKHFLNYAPQNTTRFKLESLLRRPRYTGVNTFPALVWPVDAYVDKTYFCPPSSLLLRGWMIDPFHRVARVRLVGAGVSRVLDHRGWVKISRRDVVQGFSDRYDLQDPDCGFLAFAPNILHPRAPLYLEAEMIDGAVAFLPVTPSLLTGLASIKEILSSFSLRNEAVPKGFEDVVGPAIAAMNDFRLARPSKPSVIAYGSLAAAPRCSLIIPLYGRVDFLEYQLALFSGSLAEDHEIIYVLDDPERMEETGKLAASAFARFQRPFTLVAMAQNSGFAPANNAGLRHARGKYVCFLNSDVFPSEPNWLEYMLGTLDEDPEAGVVGAVLLYEDGALQHDGCAFERLPEFGNWPFPIHPGKGLRTQNKTESCSRVEMVTGACMALRMPLARELGGFDEGFVIGDFEDADLCFRVRERGFTCVVDNRAVLYHLERQSQSIGASSWRMNLTLYNAWRFQKQWGERVR